jgi:Protein of unknown function (DUF2889)
VIGRALIDEQRHAPIAGPELKGELIHQRAYEIGSYFEDEGHFRLVGHIRDVKPDGMWGVDDDEPMMIHHMELHLVVSAITLTITEVFSKMHVHPQSSCPIIEASYQQLVGVSISRGFTNKVKELFGGPRGCTHIGALTNAMAPVAMQSVWAFFQRANPEGERTEISADESRTRLRQHEMDRNKNTCHVYAADGDMFAKLNAGADLPLPIWGIERLRKLGVDPQSFMAR